MTPERWQRVQELFEAALGQRVSVRPEFIARAAGDDPALADEVTRMLAADEQAGEFPGPPAGLPPPKASPAEPRGGRSGIISGPTACWESSATAAWGPS